MSAKVRNYSILAHGFDAKAKTQDAEMLRQTVDQVRNLVLTDGGQAARDAVRLSEW